MKTFHPLTLKVANLNRALPLNVARFIRTPLGRVALHLECLGHHPSAAPFYCQGIHRNLREWAGAIGQAAFNFMKGSRAKKCR